MKLDGLSVVAPIEREFTKNHDNNNNAASDAGGLLLKEANRLSNQSACGSNNDLNIYATPIAHLRTSVNPDDRYHMFKRRIIVGRKSKYLNQCDIVIEQSNFISRMHFSIELNDNIKKFFIFCMSKNGIFVNGRYVQRGVPYVLEDEYVLLLFFGVNNVFTPHSITFYVNVYTPLYP
jgi:hypothetical protein